MQPHLDREGGQCRCLQVRYPAWSIARPKGVPVRPIDELEEVPGIGPATFDAVHSSARVPGSCLVRRSDDASGDQRFASER
ncbi:MAG: hypothetical protein ACLP66_19030 [Polyangia bacterium]|jgi:hypothetical protein